VRQGPHWNPSPLCHDPSPIRTEEADTPPNPTAALSNARNQSPYKRQRALALILSDPESIYGVGVPGGEIFSGSRGERQTQTEPNVRSSHDGGHDGHDEGKCGHDGPANIDYGMDKRLLLRIRHQ